MPIIAAVAICAVLTLGAGALYVYSKTPKAPDKTERIGSLELVTHTIFYKTGWNEGQVHWGQTENYSLRYQGKAFSFEGRSGMYGDQQATYSGFNALFTFPSAQPAVVVNVGDPNNTSFFYLIHDLNGAPQAEFLTDTDSVSASWLDASPGTGPAVLNVAMHRGRLEGGRYLLLGLYCVLDTQTLTSYRFKQPEGANPNQFKPAIAMSPDRHSFVRFGYQNNGGAAVMIAFDFIDSASDVLPIDRKTMRFNEWAEIDAAWLDHHFEWKRAAGVHDRLAARTNIQPLPYRGYRSTDTYDPSMKEYKLMRVQPEMFERVKEFVAKELQGQPLPETLETAASFKVEGHTVHLLKHEDEVSVWMDRGPDSALVFQIGDRFDEVLKTGVHDDLFLP
ncbi:MAG: hypothetical protein LAP38_15090 [Acidobacteriia bacterium]|nr:hypothetical protein [Terriglobia bacterium]